MWNDAKYIENMNAVLQTVYGTKCDTLTKELAVDLLNSAAYIRTTTFNAGLYYWPWLENYYGENACG